MNVHSSLHSLWDVNYLLFSLRASVSPFIQWYGWDFVFSKGPSYPFRIWYFQGSKSQNSGPHQTLSCPEGLGFSVAVEGCLGIPACHAVAFPKHRYTGRTSRPVVLMAE